MRTKISFKLNRNAVLGKLDALVISFKPDLPGIKNIKLILDPKEQNALIKILSDQINK